MRGAQGHGRSPAICACLRTRTCLTDGWQKLPPVLHASTVRMLIRHGIYTQVLCRLSRVAWVM